MKWESTILLLTAVLGCGSADVSKSPESSDPLVVQLRKNHDDLTSALKKVTRGQINVDSEKRITAIYITDKELGDDGLAALTTYSSREKVLSRLKKLGLGFTQVTDAGLLQLKHFPNLEYLQLSDTRITDKGLALLAELKNLRELDLLKCKGVTDEGIEQLKSLTLMEKIRLSGTSCTGKAIAVFSNWPNLKSVALNSLKLKDDDLKALQRVKQLETLSLENSTISDAGLQILSRLTTLKRLRLSGTKISDKGAQHLARLVNLVELDLSQTNVSSAAQDKLDVLLPQWERPNAVSTKLQP